MSFVKPKYVSTRITASDDHADLDGARADAVLAQGAVGGVACGGRGGRATQRRLALRFVFSVRVPWLPGTLPTTLRPASHGSLPASHSFVWPRRGGVRVQVGVQVVSSPGPFAGALDGLPSLFGPCGVGDDDEALAVPFCRRSESRLDDVAEAERRVVADRLDGRRGTAIVGSSDLRGRRQVVDAERGQRVLGEAPGARGTSGSGAVERDRPAQRRRADRRARREVPARRCAASARPGRRSAKSRSCCAGTGRWTREARDRRPRARAAPSAIDSCRSERTSRARRRSCRGCGTAPPAPRRPAQLGGGAPRPGRAARVGARAGRFCMTGSGRQQRVERLERQVEVLAAAREGVAELVEVRARCAARVRRVERAEDLVDLDGLGRRAARAGRWRRPRSRRCECPS